MILQNGTPAPTWAPEFLFRPEPIIWVQQLFGPGLAAPFRAIDLFATTWGVLVVIGLALWLWGRDDAYALAAIVAAEAIINLVLNQLFSVPRPADPEIVKYERVALDSFPSGHLFTVTVLWGLLLARKRVPLWLAGFIVFGVAVGRLYLGVHYLADVVAGLALGILLVLAFSSVWEPIRSWFSRLSWGVMAGAAAFGIAAAAVWLFTTGSQNHFMYNSVGLAAGGILALLIEARAVGFEVGSPDGTQMASRISIGLLGLIPLLALDRATGDSALVLGAALTFTGAIWALLLAPFLFRAWGWGPSAGS